MLFLLVISAKAAEFMAREALGSSIQAENRRRSGLTCPDVTGLYTLQCSVGTAKILLLPIEYLDILAPCLP
ncbi:hypothetical protein IAI18_05605 [Acetobacteraceae bacterium H6797]|nr:hypothetical protein [Acetobacteraceae bacterium H6797]